MKSVYWLGLRLYSTACNYNDLIKEFYFQIFHPKSPNHKKNNPTNMVKSKKKDLQAD